MVQAKKTAAYRVIAGPGGKRVFRFYCDISGELCCVTKSIRADTEDEALEIAWETEGRWAFDRCPQCGRYVSSAMFNINAERCLDCAPWENEYPVFCHHCGIRLKDPDAFFCPACGARLLVGGRLNGIQKVVGSIPIFSTNRNKILDASILFLFYFFLNLHF